MGVGGSCGLTLYASGMAPAVPGYIDSGSGLEFATWPLNADDGEAPSTKPGCVVPRFLLLTFLSPGGELVVVMNGFGKVWPSLPVTESAKFPTDGANVEASRPW
ncbi:hypothetical protein CK203_113310 [Vitis vinifera]|uniref:Uncharacterized protein n=1 Tax=Vitis vinifera TaxID=29760 RepID=A0A438FGK6_VITVI|nr:hypothetical protein CK203_113310 [Vitis vinifera]